MRPRNRPTARERRLDALALMWSASDPGVRRGLVLAVALVLAANVITALAPVALKHIVDRFAADAPAALAAPVALVAAYVGLQFLGRLFAETRWYVQGVAEQRLYRRLSASLFSHVMALPMRFHLERKAGALGQTLNEGLQGYRILVNHLTVSFLPVLAQLATMAVVLIQFGYPAFMLIFAAALAAYAAAFAFGVASVSRPAKAVSSAHIDAHAVLMDNLVNYETVKSFDAERQVEARYDKALARAEREWRRYYAARTVNGLVIAVIFLLALGASIGFAARELARGAMTIGDFVLVNTYVLMVVGPLETLGVAFRDAAQGLAYIDKMLPLFREPAEPRAVGGAAPPAETPADLAFKNVSFGYAPERPIIKGVSFAVPPGRTTAIVGPSGSGKSTLTRLLMRLYEPDSGRILLDGRSTADMSLSSLRQMIAVVPQDTVLFHDTIAANIAFGRHGCTHEEVERAARLARLHDFVMSLPDGYDTVVGERGLKLSGGERQRVAIARAALKRPRVYVFDESTSSLDTRTEQEILRNLEEVSRGVTTLIIAHRLSTVVHADEILVLRHGEIVERGPHGALLAEGGVYAMLWRAQQEGRGGVAEEAAATA